MGIQLNMAHLCMHGKCTYTMQRQCCHAVYYCNNSACLYADLTQSSGETALDMAIQRGFTEVVDYLKSVQKPSTPKPGITLACMCVINQDSIIICIHV